MTNVLVTGSKGQLGRELKELNDEFLMSNQKCFFTTKDELNVLNREKIRKFIDNNDINLVINCAAYTSVDKAESEKDMAYLVNYSAVEYLAKECKIKDIPLIHISSDYVFDGQNYKPYCETDGVNPQSVYGITKLKGENAFVKSGAKGLIIRTSWVYSSFGNNFVKTMLKLARTRDTLGIVCDQVGTPTYAYDLARVILKIIKHSKFNIQNYVDIYNYSNEGVLSWYDFAKEIMKMAKIKCQINPIETKDYPTPAIRPHYSLLNKTKIKKEFGISIPYWKDSLDSCLRALGERR